MKGLQYRFLLAVLMCGAVIAALGLAFPATTNAAPKYDGATRVVNAQAGFCSVTVRPGEALYMIAARFGTTTAYLAALNNLYNANYIYAGMVLKVPCAQPYPYPQPQPQPQPYPQPQPGYQICSYYMVQRGDWLKTIAWRYGVTWQLLAQVNGLSNANYIYAGMVLKIPCAQPYPPPVCPGCPPCQGCPPVYPTPPPVCPGCPPCQGCPPVYPTQTPAPVYNNVEIRDDYYAPPVLTIHQNQFVQWVNKGNKPHTVTQGLCPGGQCSPTPGGFDSGVLNPGGTYVFAFTQLGTFAYYDAASGMGATIAVVP